MHVKYHKFWLVKYHNISSLDMVVCFDLSSTLHAIFKGNKLQNIANLMPPDCTEALNLTFPSKLEQYVGLNRHSLFLYVSN